MRFLDPEMITAPWARYAEWLSEPAWFDEATGGWVVTRFEDVRAVLRDHETFSSAAMGFGEGNPLPLLTNDPPRHTELRKLVNKAFTTAALRRLEPDIRAIANRLVRQLPTAEPVDVVQRFTIPLPVAVIASMMDIPAERSDDFKRWSDALTGTLAGLPRAERAAQVMEMASFFAEMIPERRTRPGNDLVSAVANAEVDGASLSESDIVGFCILLLIAGNETTTNLLANLLNLLADRPKVVARLRADADLVDAAIEETLRFDGPVQFISRQATRDVTVQERQISAGEVVHVVLGASNRDPREHDDPGHFRLDRERRHHHTFGHGIHFCIGAPLARLEARIGMQALLERFGQISHAPGADERTASQLLRGFNHLWLQLER